MKDLVQSLFGADCEWVEAHDLRRDQVRAATEIVLLWPDGNGYGWLVTECKVLAWKAHGARLLVLNGRRRFFALTPGRWLAYGLRRLAERFWMGELVFSLCFVVISPPLVVWDWVRGHR